ncbi:MULTISPECIES: hypothetical protein [unclassified Clostridioides]|uniref:hypothetical protein n=1 Tax=unclassified Clostridioides TaxID=2635829 RepID=UPI001D120DB1|nr:hypothetical protein [Clostridioides sp. ES-S-0145-01]MCC0681855.1 hypothetical protein [Clostridioides sp. ES-S-0005-03]MCC0709395.1 hypothetical protein [Clostridioides sp. ES-S-0190-01]UDN64052.1 hypothetical protein IC758_19430 [Clostridioides sp. ES-W-0016-02]
MAKELYEEVRQDIPSEIGVYEYFGGLKCIKRATKQILKIDEDILKYSMIRSLSRDSDKLYNTENENYINNLNNKIKQCVSKEREAQVKYNLLEDAIREEFGSPKLRELKNKYF